MFSYLLRRYSFLFYRGKIQLSDKMALNVAYFHTFYKHKKTTEKVSEQLNYTADYTRNNDVFGIGLDIDF